MLGLCDKSFIGIVMLGLCDNTSISNSGMPNIKLYRQYLAIAQNVSLSRFDSLLLHSVLTSQIK